ncbi:MAG: HAMP domain-containing protein, partial [Burkholderiales bacterium]|nr:HAMP domain-containing protein [Burkholderiales bacterium]
MKVLLERVQLWQKFCLLGAMAFILMMMPLSLFLMESNKDVENAKVELQGIPATQANGKLLEILHRQRSLAGRAAAGEAVGNWMQAELPAAIEQLEKQLAPLGQPDVDKIWQEMRAKLAKLPSETNAERAYRRHFEIFEGLNKINEIVVDAYGLALDPDADTYYLIDAAYFQAPAWFDSLDALRQHGAQKQRDAQVANVAIYLRKNFEQSNGNSQNSLSKAKRANVELSSVQFPATSNAIEQFAQNEFTGNAQHVDQVSWNQVFDEAASKHFAFRQVLITELERLLNARISRLQHHQLQLVAAVALVAVLMTLLGTAVLGSIARPIRTAVKVAQAVAGGKLDTVFDVSGSNEAAQLLKSLQTMTDGLQRAALEATENARVKIALDTAAANTMIFAPDGKVIYFNHAMQSCVQELAKVVPTGQHPFTAQNLLQHGFDRYPEFAVLHQASLLHVQQHAQPQQHELRLGERYFTLSLTPIIGANNERLGIVAEWRDQTDAVLAEIEAQNNARIKMALDSVSLPVRIADRDGKILYINRTMQATLSRDEQAFKKANVSFSATNVVGANIAMFYADPQNALKTLASIEGERRSRMTLGGRQYDVMTAA